MATLKKLEISGIRSFGPHEDQAQQVKFGVPVTLILGQNGCGKTTIIECLKYVCSGELPGGTLCGQGFVNDPKMSGASSTKGHVKLKFTDPRNNEITVSRVVEVTQTATALKFQSKNQTIKKVKENGEVSSLSNRCADITSECCQLMNVSPAVLNNVIFCHQENSLWPLDEGKKLKERFDEIFDAQRYNKCCELFAKEKKERNTNLKTLNSQLEYRRDKKEQAEKLNRNLQEKKEKLERFQNDIAAKTEQLETLKKRLFEIMQLKNDLDKLEKELSSKEATKSGILEEQKTIKRAIEFEFEGTDAELQDKIDSFQKDKTREQELITELETRKVEIEDKNKVLVQAIQQAQTQSGTLNEQKNQYMQKCKARTKLITDAKNIVNMNLTDFAENEGAKKALNELSNELENQEMCLMVTIDDKDTQEKQLQEAIDKARESKVTMQKNVEFKEKEKKENEKKIEEIANELALLSTADSFLDGIHKRIENIDATVSKLNASFKEGEETKKIETYKREIQTKENKLEALNSEHRILQQNDVTEGKMEAENRLIMEKQKEIYRLKTKHSEDFKLLFGGAVPEKNLKESVIAKQRNSNLLVKNLTDEINKKQKEVTTLEVQRHNQREKVSEAEAELQSNKSSISKACNGNEFNESLNSSFQKKERLHVDKGQYNSVKIIYGQFIKKFEEQNPCCPVCETNFTGKVSLVQKIVRTLKNKLERVPQELTRVENELKKEEDFYNKLQQLKLVNDDTESLQNTKIPQLKQELAKIEEDLSRKLEELNGLKLQLKEPQKIVEISNRVISDVGSLDQNILDLEKSQRTLEVLKLSLIEGASGKSKQEIEAEIDEIKFEVGELRNKVETTTKNINNHKDRIQKLLEERKGVVDQQVHVTRNVQNRPLLEQQKKEMEEKISTLNEEVIRLRSQLTQKEEELQHATKSKQTASELNRKDITQQRGRIASFKEKFQDIEKLQKDIDDYFNQDIDGKLSTVEDKLKEYRNKENALEITKAKIVEAISEKKENLAKEELHFRTLQNNVILREKKTQELKLESEIQDLKKRIGDFNDVTIFDEKRRLEIQYTNLEQQISGTKGEKIGLQQAIVEVQQELDSPDIRKAYANYLSKLYELKISEKVMKDIDKYVKALDKAVLEFHKSKMVHINRTIRNLWRNTYRGNDIDHIEIKAEETKGTINKRSYNYKVVQTKKGIELEMRGRCSAGQKVLACLIIRMALAETLSSNCGILALDEPTTNLDRANVLSLSDTLARIITARHNEKSFQLLIITHDEEFLNALTMAQGVHSYFKVDRDKDGYSVISAKTT